MIASNEVDALARELIQGYINDCACSNEADIAKVLMRLTAFCGLTLCSAIGQPSAVRLMKKSTDYIATTQEGKEWYPLIDADSHKPK